MRQHFSFFLGSHRFFALVGIFFVFVLAACTQSSPESSAPVDSASSKLEEGQFRFSLDRRAYGTLIAAGVEGPGYYFLFDRGYLVRTYATSASQKSITQLIPLRAIELEGQSDVFYASQEAWQAVAKHDLKDDAGAFFSDSESLMHAVLPLYQADDGNLFVGTALARSENRETQLESFEYRQYPDYVVFNIIQRLQ